MHQVWELIQVLESARHSLLLPALSMPHPLHRLVGGTLVPFRAGLVSPATAAEVFRFLAAGAGLPFRVELADPTTATVVFRSAASLLSWGERVEVSVVGNGSGCTILFRGTGVHPLNPTANPKGVAGRIALAVEQSFGPLQPIA